MPSIFAQTSPWDEILPPFARVGIVFALALAWGIWMRRRESQSARAAERSTGTLAGDMAPDRPRAVAPRKIVMALLLQALVWGALTVAFAASLRLAGPQPWPNALHFAALNWMPWAVLAPLVFWFSGRFPLERGHLWGSIPAHVLGCIGCVAITVWMATYVGFITRPSSGRFEERRAVFERPPADQETSAPAISADRGTSRAEPGYAAPVLQRSSRPERFRLEGRPPFGRRGNGPGWWPFLGTTLLRANFDAAVYLIVVFAAHALAFYRRAQERERHAVTLAAGLHRAKLDALRLQLQPHFLFNTLNAISTLVHRDATAADELIGDLSDLLRVSLQTTQHQVPLAQELGLLDRYLAIEKARLGERLRIVREIDPAAETALVPTFLLQPLVENAIRHGIEPRLAAGMITLRAYRDGERLKLLVADDGVGLAATNGSGRRGIGITNTEERLHALHGEAATLVIATPAHGGVEVRITLPFVRESSADAKANGGAVISPSPNAGAQPT